MILHTVTVIHRGPHGKTVVGTTAAMTRGKALSDAFKTIKKLRPLLPGLLFVVEGR